MIETHKKYSMRPPTSEGRQARPNNSMPEVPSKAPSRTLQHRHLAHPFTLASEVFTFAMPTVNVDGHLVTKRIH